MGSEVNGFLSTINEVFIYISLIEGGLSVALLNSLYKPIHENDNITVSKILTASRIKYKKIALCYFLASCVVGAVYPLLINTTITHLEIFISFAAYGFGGAALLYFSSSIVQYLLASGRGYVKERIYLFSYVLNALLKALCIVFLKNVAFVCLLHGAVCIVEGLIYQVFFRVKYKNVISFNEIKPSFEPLSEQKYYMIHQFSSAIFGATDLFVISIFCSLNDASIYSVYSLIFSSLTTVISSIFNSLKYILGTAYSKGSDYYKRVHDAFECVYLALNFSLFLVAFLLSGSFVEIYMAGSDINYVDRQLPLLFLFVKLLSNSRAVCSNAHNIANKAKENIIPTLAESAINLSVSLLLVINIGLYGVLIGTIVALLFRTNQIILFTNKRILHRSAFSTYKYIIVYSGVFLFAAIGYRAFLTFRIDDYLSFFLVAIVLTLLSLALFGVCALLLNGDIKNKVLEFVKRMRNNAFVERL